MIVDKIENLIKYESIVHEVAKLDEFLPIKVMESDTEFDINKDNCALFVITSGLATFTTTWRENIETEDVIAAVNAGAGHFVLYLPGEPVLIKLGPKAEIKKYNLE